MSIKVRNFNPLHQSHGSLWWSDITGVCLKKYSVNREKTNINMMFLCVFFFFFQAEDGIRDYKVTGVQTCALPISLPPIESNPRGLPGCLDHA